MRKTIYLPSLAMAFLCSVPATAQTDQPGIGLQRYPTEKGNYLIGANLLNAAAGFSGGSTYQSYYSVSASPRVGYFLSDNLALGATLNGNFQRSGDYRSKAYGAGIFGRYYFGRITDKDGNLNRLRFFAEAGINYVQGAARLTDINGLRTRQRFNATNAYGVTGINYFLTRNVALELGVSYQRNLGSPSSYSGNRNQLGLNAGMQFFIPGRKQRQPMDAR